jgi:CDP-6-deoxy-D-xylo-4-hexulose-3-dehydrase
MISLVKETIDGKDIDRLVDWLKTHPRLTKGEITLKYESRWSDWLGVKYSTFVNSGSSANLLMLATLIEAGDLKPGDSVLVPAVSWATDLSPVMQLGLKPVLCDCNLEDFSVDISQFKDLISRSNVKAAIVVPLLGFVPEMEELVSLCDQSNTILLEDCCESLGSRYEGDRKLGTFGVMSTFSTYFGHHISTIEGGMVCTSNSKYDTILKSIRSHGWSRDWSIKEQETHRKSWGISEFDSLYTFYYCGFNVRSTDLQAYIGLGQLDKLDKIIEARNNNYLTYLRLLGIKNKSRHFNSNFAFPLIHPNRNSISKSLLSEGIECRPLVCGSMGKQPFYLKKYPDVENNLPNAEKVRVFGMYLPNHHLLTEEDIEKVCSVVRRYL